MESADRLCLGRMQNPVRGFLHGSAAVLSMLGAVALWHAGSGDLGMQIALVVFAASLVGLYTVSSLYHSVSVAGGVEASHAARRPLDDLPRGRRHLHADRASSCSTAGCSWRRSSPPGASRSAASPRRSSGRDVGDWFSITMQMVQGWLALPLLRSRGARTAARGAAPGGRRRAALHRRHDPLRDPPPAALAARVLVPRGLPRLRVRGSALHYTAILMYVARFRQLIHPLRVVIPTREPVC